MPTIPNNFSGAKFVLKFGEIPFWADHRNTLICPSLPNLTDADIADCVIDMIAYDERNTDLDNANNTIKAEYKSAIDTLTQIENATSPTNAQVIAAMKFMAKTLRLLLRLLARRYT